jgi:hypothetical protein
MTLSQHELDLLTKQYEEVNSGKLINSPGWYVIGMLLDTIKALQEGKPIQKFDMEIEAINE